MELILNIDFNDMVVAEAIEGVPFVGSRGGWYREEDLTGMIGRAAACGYRKIYFRVAVCGRAACPSGVKEPPDHDPAWAQTLRRYDPLDVAVRAAHDAGVECWAWLTPFDECGREPGHPGSFQSRFSAEHPEFQLASREGDDTLWGVYCFGYPEVVDYFLRHLDEVLDRGPDGVFFSNRTHSNMDLRCREYGFNEPVIQRYRERHGGDPREADAYDLQRFSRV